MGSGTICDAQYLFSEDILGYNNGHIPRHAKTYTNLKKTTMKLRINQLMPINFSKDVEIKNIQIKNITLKLIKKN